MSDVSAELNQISGSIIDAAIAVHSSLGPGLLESAYEHCLAHELLERGLRVDRQVLLPVTYKRIKLDAGYRLDLIVEKCVIVEVKAIEKLLRVHEAQLLTYLKLSGQRLGLILNFNVVLLKYGIKRLIGPA